MKTMRLDRHVGACIINLAAQAMGILHMLVQNNFLPQNPLRNLCSNQPPWQLGRLRAQKRSKRMDRGFTEWTRGLRQQLQSWVEEGNAMQSTQGFRCNAHERKSSNAASYDNAAQKTIKQKNGNTGEREKALARKVYGGYLALARVGAVVVV
jgi:hypothetical protein